MALVRSFDAKFATRSALSYLPSLFRFPSLVWANRFMVQNFLRRELEWLRRQPKARSTKPPWRMLPASWNGKVPRERPLP